MHVAQPETTLAALRSDIEVYDEPFRLAGLSLATTLTGSALIALALAKARSPSRQPGPRRMSTRTGTFLNGARTEAARRRARRLSDFRAAALALAVAPPSAPGRGLGQGCLRCVGIRHYFPQAGRVATHAAFPILPKSVSRNPVGSFRP